jgi:hypothetical protein
MPVCRLFAMVAISRKVRREIVKRQGSPANTLFMAVLLTVEN